MRSGSLLRALGFGCLTVALGGMVPANPERQAAPERHWIAFGFDSKRVVVYFDTVNFHRPLNDTVGIMHPQRSYGFYEPHRLSAADVAKLPKRRDMERLAAGDRYDVILDGGRVFTITLTTIVAGLSDEQVGNVSYVGAVGTIDPAGLPYYTRNHYVVRRHDASRVVVDPQPTAGSDVQDAAITPSMKAALTRLLAVALVKDDTSARRAANDITPNLLAQTFRVAGGGSRFYARATWALKYRTGDRSAYKIGGWFSAEATPRLLAVETCPCHGEFGDELPQLRNVVDLGKGRTALIVSMVFGDGGGIGLVEYKDGVPFNKMRVMQMLTAGE